VDPERRLVLDDFLRAAVRGLRADPHDREASVTLDRALRPRLLRYFHRPPLTRDDAEDLVQKTLIAVFQHVAELAEEDRFVGWLFAIARNVKLTEHEKRRAERLVVAVSDGDLTHVPSRERSPHEAIERGEWSAAMSAAIATLPARQRQCLTLRVRDELAYEQIADLLRLNVFTVRNHIAEAKNSLRRILGGS
jgi:RNA polymerase sigma-70 factor (ECF subfamily)